MMQLSGNPALQPGLPSRKRCRFHRKSKARSERRKKAEEKKVSRAANATFLPGRAQVLPRPDRNGQGVVEGGHGVHVLLDDGEGVRADGRHGFEDRREVRDAIRRLGHDALLDGERERNVVLQHVRQEVWMHLLQVQVADPVRVVVDQRQVVAQVVRVVAGVEAVVPIERLWLNPPPTGMLAALVG